MSRLVAVLEPDPIQTGRKRERADTEWHSLLRPATTRRIGKWWRVDPPYESNAAASSAAYEINSGRSQAIPEGRWEACSRNAYLFVRYLGKA
jgi:hypothetical protein